MCIVDLLCLIIQLFVFIFLIFIHALKNSYENLVMWEELHELLFVFIVCMSQAKKPELEYV